MSLQNLFLNSKKENKKLFSVLIDPDKASIPYLNTIIQGCNHFFVDIILVGGSLITSGSLAQVLDYCKQHTAIPILLFPGNLNGIHPHADAMLFLNLISGRNPEYLIGQQVAAAPLLKQMKLEVISTSYILVDGGSETTASYMSNTKPIPPNKPEIAAATALAGEYMGHKCVFLDAGSGAKNPVPKNTIEAVKQTVALPLLVGGGIQNPEQAHQAWRAGADMVIVGTALEKDPSLLPYFAEAKNNIIMPSLHAKSWV